MLPLGSAGGFQVMKMPPSRICPCSSRGSEGTVKAVKSNTDTQYNRNGKEEVSTYLHNYHLFDIVKRFRVLIRVTYVGFINLIY